jgi:hypothetical protein
MSRLRFATAQAVFETFPELAQKIAGAPGNQPPIDFLKKLAADGRIADAVSFCAYLLSRREAVWWACGCVRMLSGDLAKEQAAGLLAAEAWVYRPDDEERQHALEIGTAGSGKDVMTWLARAAGWSGGFLNRSQNRQDPIPPYMTARAVRIAVLLSAAKVSGAQRQKWFDACIAEGIKLAESGLS